MIRTFIQTQMKTLQQQNTTQLHTLHRIIKICWQKN